MLLLYLTTAEPSEQDKVIYIYHNYYSYMAYTAGKYLKNKADVEPLPSGDVFYFI